MNATIRRQLAARKRRIARRIGNQPGAEGQQPIMAAGSGSLRLYDTGRGGAVYSLRGVGGGIACAALLPDARACPARLL